MTKNAAFQLLCKQESASAHITETATLSGRYKKDRVDLPEMVFTISWIIRTIFFALAAGALGVFYAAIVKGNQVLPSLLMLVFSGVFFYIGCIRSRIILTSKSLIINKQSYLWTDIHETYIVDRPGTRNRSYFLVLTLKDGTIIRHSIGMHGDHIKMSAYIEYFKRTSLIVPGANQLDHK